MTSQKKKKRALDSSDDEEEEEEDEEKIREEMGVSYRKEGTLGYLLHSITQSLIITFSYSLA